MKREKRQPTEWEKYLQVIYRIWDWYSNYIENSHNSIIKRQLTQLKIGQRILIEISS